MPESKKALSFLKPQSKSGIQNRNPEQEKAIMHRQGPMMVLAGPGSGKTYTLTQRVYHLIHTYGISPNQILVITFTKQAALEMEKRYLSLDSQGSVYFSTFHALFYRIIRSEERYKEVSICDEIQKKAFLKSAYGRMELAKTNPDLLKDPEMCDALLKEISGRKAKLASHGKPQESMCIPEEAFEELYELYNEELQWNAKIDYDDMVILCLKELRANRKLKKKVQERFQYILVDEFQDISPLQFEIVQILVEKHHNLFVVGDDDQSIYGFRGSSPKIMLEFGKVYPEYKRIQLVQNYRSCPEVTEAALRVIEENKVRFSKKILNQKQEKGTVRILNCSNEEQEYGKMVSLIKQDLKKGKSVAILCRTSQAFGDIQIILQQHGLSIDGKRQKKDNLADEMTGDLLAYYAIACGDFGRKEFLKVMNKPLRYIPRELIPADMTFSSLKSQKKLRLDIKNRVSIMEKQCKLLGSLPPKAFVTYLFKSIGYESYLKEYGKKHNISPGSLHKHSKALLQISENFDDMEAFVAYLRKDGLNAELTKNKALVHMEDRLYLLTMHSAKGLEYDSVYLPDCVEGNIPHYKCKSEEAIEEERRLFYVAMTRAKEDLCIFYLDGSGKKPSRYLSVLKRGYLC